MNNEFLDLISEANKIRKVTIENVKVDERKKAEEEKRIKSTDKTKTYSTAEYLLDKRGN